MNSGRTHAMEIMEEKEWGMVGKRGCQFVVEDKPFLINGFNTYWLMVLSAYERKKEVTKVLHQASSVGLNVCRTWAFYDAGSRALQITPGVYNEKVFEVFTFLFLFLFFYICMYLYDSY